MPSHHVYCINKVTNVMPLAVGRLYVANHFDEEAKQSVSSFSCVKEIIKSRKKIINICKNKRRKT